MNELELIKIDNLIDDFSKVFNSKHSNIIFSKLLELYNFKIADELIWSENVTIRFYYNKELGIGINSLFGNNVVLAFSIIYF